MPRHASLAVLIAVLGLPIAAQVPTDWKVRIDGSQSASAPDANPNLKFVTAGKGFQVAGGPAAIFWNPAHTVTGNFSVKATFMLMKPSVKVTHYGLVFGGADMEGQTPTYVYFTIAQDGSYLIRHREGDAFQVVDQSPHPAIIKPDASGKSTNRLQVLVEPTAVSYVNVSYLVNGLVVAVTPTFSGLTKKTDGIVGFRIDDPLDLQVEGFEVKGTHVHQVVSLLKRWLLGTRHTWTGESSSGLIPTSPDRWR